MAGRSACWSSKSPRFIFDKNQTLFLIERRPSQRFFAPHAKARRTGHTALKCYYFEHIWLPVNAGTCILMIYLGCRFLTNLRTHARLRPYFCHLLTRFLVRGAKQKRPRSKARTLLVALCAMQFRHRWKGDKPRGHYLHRESAGSSATRMTLLCSCRMEAGQLGVMGPKHIS